jgi:hypothetical protein
MEDKYLVFSGTEFGLWLADHDLEYVNLEKAEEKFKEYLESNGCAGMWKVEDDKLVEVKMEDTFE